jgi:hypothetical protein
MRIWYDGHIGDETHYGPQNRNSDSAMELANSPRHQVYDGTFKLGVVLKVLEKFKYNL